MTALPMLCLWSDNSESTPATRISDTQIRCNAPKYTTPRVGQLRLQIFNNVIKDVSNFEWKDCTQVISFEPSSLCLGQRGFIHLKGRAFSFSSGATNCHFKLSSLSTLVVSSAVVISDDHLQCQFPVMNMTETAVLTLEMFTDQIAPGGWPISWTDCTKVVSITPRAACLGVSTVVDIKGSGFNYSDSAKCHYGRNYSYPAKILDGTHMQCSSPPINMSLTLPISLELFPVHYRTNVSYVWSECKESRFDFLLLAYIAAGAVPFLFFLAWFFWPLLTGKSKKELEKQKLVTDELRQPLNSEPAPLAPGLGTAVVGTTLLEEPVSPGGTKKKWADVDASKYIWSREGGSARPFPVKWGELGPTSAAAHLEVTERKDVPATVQVNESDPESLDSFLEESGPPAKSGCCSCWGRCFHRIGLCCSGCYASCASCRPLRE